MDWVERMNKAISYIRRRLTLAAFELQNNQMKVIDLALKYGYESPEAFTSSFQNLHGTTLTAARNIGTRLFEQLWEIRARVIH